MSVQFILGGSGSGKSEYLYRRITEEAAKHPKKNYLVIVPEQFTLSTQQKMVSLSPNGAIMNVDILSFKRLAYRVFDDMGMSDISVLEETGKNLLLRRIAQEEDEKLTVLKHNMSRMGYVEQLKSLISEFVQYNITPDHIKALEQNPNFSGSFVSKLKDVNLLYEKFLSYMQDHYVMAEEILNILRDHVKDSLLLQDAVIILDEFTGFTPIQYGLLSELLKVTEAIYISLAIDEKESMKPSRGMEDLFDLSKTTIKKVSDIATELHVEIKQPIVLESPANRRFANAPALAHLEQNLFRTTYKKFHEQSEDIQLVQASNPKEEVVFVAREINRLVREHDYRYKDIAVVTGNIEAYRVYAEELFAKYRIPCFIDATSEIAFSPFIEAIRALLQIIDSNYSYESIMRFMRTGFSGIEQEEIDYLDNYLLATGIRGKNTWKKSWLGRRGKSKDFNLARVEEVRISFMDILAPLEHVDSKKSSTIADAVIAVYEILVQIDAANRLMQMSARYLELGLQTKAKECDQIYEKTMQLFEKYTELLGEEPYDINTFSELFDAGLSAISLAAIPPGYDAVTVGDIERTRLNGAKILFFIGLNDGVIPKNTNNGGIISEYERQALLDADVHIAPGAKEKAFIQRFYLYRNVTKPSDRLYLSYARSGSDGKVLQASYFVKVITRMFPEIKEVFCNELSATPDFSSEQVAMEYLAQGNQDKLWYATAKALEEVDAEAVERLTKAPYTCYEIEPISKNVARELYGDTLYGSVTRIEKYFACAYAHFLSYGLKLKERDEAGLSAMDVGELYHKAMELYGRKINESEFEWKNIRKPDADAFAKESMNEALSDLGHTEFIEESGSDTYQLQRMQEIFRKNAWVITTQIAQGEFVPEDFEIKFDGTNEQMLQYSLKDNRVLNIRGTIDRLDTFRSNGKLYVKIVDYKSGNTSFDLESIYYGLQLQLSVYLNAALKHKQATEGKEVIPAGVLYQHIDDPVLSEGNEGFEEYLKALKPNGKILNDSDVYIAMDHNLEEPGTKSQVIPVALKTDGALASQGTSVMEKEQLQMIGEYAIEMMKRSGNQIYDGDVSVNPYQNDKKTACDWCSYKGICGFDKKIPGYQFHKLKKLGKEDEIMQRMEVELAAFKSR